MAIKDVDKGVTIFARDFGVVGDGITDDTAAAQAALDYGSANSRVVDFTNLAVRITSGLTCSGPGIRADVGFAPATFLADGGGTYTALTVTGVPSVLRVTINALNSNTINGINFDHAAAVTGATLRVFNCGGFGVQLDTVYDSVFESISVERCGSSTTAAFIMTSPNTDSCNENHILRLQVEQSNFLAIYIATTTLTCQFDSIHSETVNGATPAGASAWYFGGQDCVYNDVRLAGDSTQGAYFNLNASTITGLRLEQSAATFATWGSYVTVLGSYGSGSWTTIPAGGNFITVFQQCVLTTFTSSAPDRFHECTIGNYQGGASGHGADQHQLHDCTVGTLSSVAGDSAAILWNCSVNVASLMSPCIFHDCQVAPTPQGSSLNVRYLGVTFIGCTIVGDILVNTGTVTCTDTVIQGNLIYENGSQGCIFNGQTYCTGTLQGGGIGNTPPNAGYFNSGQETLNLFPAVGAPKSWICTASGSPGTWVSTGNL